MAMVWLEELGKMKKLNDLIGTLTRNLPGCRINPQPYPLPREQNPDESIWT
jgi:hypothetical protein